MSVLANSTEHDSIACYAILYMLHRHRLHVPPYVCLYRLPWLVSVQQIWSDARTGQTMTGRSRTVDAEQQTENRNKGSLPRLGLASLEGLSDLWLDSIAFSPGFSIHPGSILTRFVC